MIRFSAATSNVGMQHGTSHDTTPQESPGSAATAPVAIWERVDHLPRLLFPAVQRNTLESFSRRVENISKLNHKIETKIVIAEN